MLYLRLKRHHTKLLSLLRLEFASSSGYLRPCCALLCSASLDCSRKSLTVLVDEAGESPGQYLTLSMSSWDLHKPIQSHNVMDTAFRTLAIGPWRSDLWRNNYWSYIPSRRADLIVASTPASRRCASFVVAPDLLRLGAPSTLLFRHT